MLDVQRRSSKAFWTLNPKSGTPPLLFCAAADLKLNKLRLLYFNYHSQNLHSTDNCDNEKNPTMPQKSSVLVEVQPRTVSIIEDDREEASRSVAEFGQSLIFVELKVSTANL